MRKSPPPLESQTHPSVRSTPFSRLLQLPLLDPQRRNCRQPWPLAAVSVSKLIVSINFRVILYFPISFFLLACCDILISSVISPLDCIYFFIFFYFIAFRCHFFGQLRFIFQPIILSRLCFILQPKFSPLRPLGYKIAAPPVWYRPRGSRQRSPGRTTTTPSNPPLPSVNGRE